MDNLTDAPRLEKRRDAETQGTVSFSISVTNLHHKCTHNFESKCMPVDYFLLRMPMHIHAQRSRASQQSPFRSALNLCAEEQEQLTVTLLICFASVCAEEYGAIHSQPIGLHCSRSLSPGATHQAHAISYLFPIHFLFHFLFISYWDFSISYPFLLF